MDILALVKQIGLWVLGIAVVYVGIRIMIVGTLDLSRALKGSNKDWGQAITGLAIAIGGALLLVIGGMGMFNLYTQLSGSVPGITR